MRTCLVEEVIHPAATIVLGLDMHRLMLPARFRLDCIVIMVARAFGGTYERAAVIAVVRIDGVKYELAVGWV